MPYQPLPLVHQMVKTELLPAAKTFWDERIILSMTEEVFLLFDQVDESWLTWTTGLSRM